MTHRTSLATLQTKLCTNGTNPLIIQAITVLITAYHQSAEPICPTPPFYKKRQHDILKEIFKQQTRLGPSAIIRGIVTRNWVLLQNLHQKSPPESPNLQWHQLLIRTIWDYSHSIWVSRYQHVNHSSKDNPHSLTHTEQLTIIRQFLRTPRRTLTREERRLHLNISKGMKHAHTKTLDICIHLLREVRAQAIRQKATGQPLQRGMQLITKFFRRKPS